MQWLIFSYRNGDESQEINSYTDHKTTGNPYFVSQLLSYEIKTFALQT